MRVVHLSTKERSGGAARAANRLHRGLRASGVESHMVVHSADTSDSAVHPPGSAPERLLEALAFRLDGLPVRLYPDRRSAPFSPAWMPGPASRRVRRLEPDLVHLHWIGGGFVGLDFLARFGRPVVWTLHDMWAFTGGCHYSGGCERYRGTCGACPTLGSERNRDLSRWTWRRKERDLGNVDLTAVAPSRWMARRAAESSLLGERRIEVVSNGLDLGTYRPLDKEACRAELGLPGDRFLVAFGAVGPEADPRKGADLLQETVERLGDRVTEAGVELVVFGGRDEDERREFSLPIHRIGYLDDDRALARAYGAADLFVMPSRQDNLPNTVLESLACGTPVVGWAVGGVPEMVESGTQGLLVPGGDTEALADAICRLAEADGERAEMSRAARRRAEAEFSVERQAGRYEALYREVLA